MLHCVYCTSAYLPTCSIYAYSPQHFINVYSASKLQSLFVNPIAHQHNVDFLAWLFDYEQPPVILFGLSLILSQSAAAHRYLRCGAPTAQIKWATWFRWHRQSLACNTYSSAVNDDASPKALAAESWRWLLLDWLIVNLSVNLKHIFKTSNNIYILWIKYNLVRCVVSKKSTKSSEKKEFACIRVSVIKFQHT